MPPTPGHQVTASPEELLTTLRRMFPREFDMASLQLINEKQGQRIAELEQLQALRDTSELVKAEEK
jgi:hypothetical protein